jgi:hypothetical protein
MFSRPASIPDSREPEGRLRRADDVGIGLERQPEDADRFARHRIAESLLDLGEGSHDLAAIDGLDGPQQGGIVVLAVGDLLERAHVLGKT